MIKIIFEDDYYIVANKPSGLLTHPSDECRQVKENLLFMLRDHVGQHVYPINRLDRAVSGLILFGKSVEVVNPIQKIWNSDLVCKKYLALVHGHLEPEGSFSFDLENAQKKKQPAVTLYRTIKEFEDSSFVEIEIKTGRRHQIRRHFSRRMHAILGDRKHGRKKWNDEYLEKFGLKRIFLHSHKLKFSHPYTNEVIGLDCPLDDGLDVVLDRLCKH